MFAAKLTEAGCEPGQFLVRSRGAANPNDYVLCAAYKGKPTHHLIIKDAESGNYLINKKAYGGHSSIQKVNTQQTDTNTGAHAAQRDAQTCSYTVASHCSADPTAQPACHVAFFHALSGGGVHQERLKQECLF